MTERIGCYLGRLRNDRVPVAPARGYCTPDLVQQLCGSPRILERGGLHVNRDCQHAASDVASHRLGIDQLRGRDNDADAHLSGKVYIGHHRDLLNIRGAPETLKRLRHVPIKRSSQPAPEQSDRRITHLRLPAPRPVQTTALALAFWRSPSPP